MIKIIHPLAGMLAMLTIAVFWFSTVLAELFGTYTTIVLVNTMIPWGFFVLIPALITVGGSGVYLAKGRKSGVIGSKLKRMPFIAANGIIVLIPSALFLASKANSDVLSEEALSPPPPPPCPEQRRLGAVSLKQTLQRTFAASAADSLFCSSSLLIFR